jgi:hypothetical protein
LFLVVALAAAESRLRAQPAAPAPPKEYQVHIRYRIRATGNQRIAQFLEMTRYLQSIGFQKDLGPENEVEDPDQTQMAGTIASGRAREILHERHTRAILLIPTGYQLPAEADRQVKVQLELKSGLALPSQRLLADQVRGLLQGIGFQEAIGYDNRGHTRVVGRIPTANLDQLLDDLRWQSTGWLTPRLPAAELPLPIRNTWPVRVVMVMPEPPGVPPAQSLPAPRPVAAGQEDLSKIARDLLSLAKHAEPLRMEVVLSSLPRENDPVWRQLLAAAPGLMIQGHLGQLVTIRARPNQAAALARLPQVATVRLPRPASVQYVPPDLDARDPQAALAATGLDKLHKRGYRGRGVRVAIVDGDFRGYQQFVGKQLPARTRYVDLTAECESSLEPKNYPSGGPSVGQGTQSALAMALAAPEADLTLIRVDPEAPYQLQAVAQYINGDAVRSNSLEARSDELTAEAERLQLQREQLVAERKQVLESFGEDEASIQRREAYFKKEAELAKEEKSLAQRQQRFSSLVRDLRNLKGIRVVACGLVWDDGYPVDGGSSLSRYFDDRPFRAALWFQSVGNTRGQAWAGLFRDLDGNGVMEFAKPETPLPKERWTRELNFLGWQPLEGPATPDLPKTKLRVSIQWREPHEPEYWGQQPDPYRVPLVDVRLLLLRQRDPTGSKLPADDLEAVAGTSGVPLRTTNAPDSATYEQSLEFAVASPGRYALRVEGRVPASTRPASEPKLPELQVFWELRPRLFVNLLDESSRTAGRVVFSDFPSDEGNQGPPADAHTVVSVGAADLSGKPQGYSASGPALGQQLHAKPDVFTFAVLPPGLQEVKGSAGTTLATGFAAGLAASALSEGRPVGKLLREIRLHGRESLRLP